MNKTQLNQQIILCRPMVKSAKVCVVRKLIKKIKILRGCKREELREKKFRKARRLTAEIHTMKILKPDYVTKFALITEDYKPSGSNTKLKRKRNACAKLAKHNKIKKRVDEIREKFANWREELPPLLVRVSKHKFDKEKPDVKDEEPPVESVAEVEETCERPLSDPELNANKHSRKSSDSMPKKCEETDANPSETPKKVKDKKPKVKTKTVERSDEQSRASGRRKKEREEKDIQPKSGDDDADEDDPRATETVPDVKETKIDDPFFIGKKVIPPKLVPTTEIERKEKSDFTDRIEDEIKPRWKEKRTERQPKRSFNQSNDPVAGDAGDDLHPSWKAKKIQMIKPFEGKKIRFD